MCKFLILASITFSNHCGKELIKLSRRHTEQMLESNRIVGITWDLSIRSQPLPRGATRNSAWDPRLGIEPQAPSVGAPREIVVEIRTPPVTGAGAAESGDPGVPLRTIQENAGWHADSRRLFTFIYIFRGRRVLARRLRWRRLISRMKPVRVNCSLRHKRAYLRPRYAPALTSVV